MQSATESGDPSRLAIVNCRRQHYFSLRAQGRRQRKGAREREWERERGEGEREREREGEREREV